MRLKRTAAIAVAIFAVLAAAAFAANWHTGTYKGKTRQQVYAPNKHFRKGHIRFRVTAAGKVKGLRFEVLVRCSDNSTTTWDVTRKSAIPVSQKGWFKLRTLTHGGTGRIRLAGRLKGKRAHGTLRRYDRENSQGQEDPNGVKCHSGKVKWSTKLKKTAKVK